MTIPPAGYLPALARAEEIGATPIWVHTHPGSNAKPLPSTADAVVDTELRPTFRARSGSDMYATFIVSPAERLFAFTGRTETDSEAGSIDHLMVVGARWSFLPAADSDAPGAPAAPFDRQIRAFGGAVQNVLGQLRIGIVGAGGTGSAVAEQVTRLGVRDLLVIDPKNLTESNVTRVYGSTRAQVGEPKAQVAASHLRRIDGSVHVRAIVGAVTDEAVARLLTSCDVVFGCTDDNTGRLVLSRLASYYLIPVIDVGVLLSSTAGRIDGIDGRVTVLYPGAACLVCRGRIDLARAAAEHLPERERAALQAEGYAPELAGVEPAVVSYTSLVASIATAELLERLIGYGPDPEPSEVLVRAHDRELSTNLRAPKPNHYCDRAAGYVGYGDTTPFLGQTWSRA